MAYQRVPVRQDLLLPDLGLLQKLLVLAQLALLPQNVLLHFLTKRTEQKHRLQIKQKSLVKMLLSIGRSARGQ
ncbi:hypothetical protein EON65_28640 [archaeon]|nr:MAG: hypothetical protein EON65_28640 [archaeon]